MTNKRTITDHNASLILKLASGIDKCLINRLPVSVSSKDKKVKFPVPLPFISVSGRLLDLQALCDVSCSAAAVAVLIPILHMSVLGIWYAMFIDPPYNTRNKDFVYQDDKIGRDDGYRHSKWLSFLSARLEIAQRLLSDSGAIFISIDDNEIANLRLLCDQVFGEENFVNQITLLCNPKGRSQDKYFATCHEYLLVYSKRPLPAGSFSVDKSNERIEQDYNKEDEGGKYRLLELRNTHREFDRTNRPNLFYPIYVCPDEPAGSTVSLVQDDDHSLPVYPMWPDGHEGCWTWGQPLVQKDMHLLVGQRKGRNWKIYRKAYAVTGGAVAKQKMFSIWREPEYYNTVTSDFT